ncbi:MAG: FAD-dependent oxidoreductase, partial [Rhodobacteraceae bacterium]|nr:FAD-dependent oxidoreductase [Paracoccaceae bacterium]
MVVTPFILTGAMGPVSTAASVAQAVAESMMCCAFAQLVRPGAPFVMGNFLSSMSLKSGAPTFGMPEPVLSNYVIGQMARRLGLPLRCGGSLTASKIEDAQAAYESADSMHSTMLAGSNYTLHAAGWLEGGLSTGFEKLIMDADRLGSYQKFLGQGLDLGPDAFARDAYEQVAPGGHFLGSDHTMRNYQTAFYEPKLSDHAKVVVIGGGVVGCSILFHLAKFGWKDVILLERDELTSGSSWHAAGQIHTISSDPNISRLQGYTIDLYKEIEETSGHSVGLHMTGGFYLASNKEWYDYLKRERSKARYMGLHQEFISPAEVAERHPLIDPKHYYAALWDDQDGDLDPSGATYAFAKSARVHGAQYLTHTPVTATTQRADGSWDV